MSKKQTKQSRLTAARKRRQAARGTRRKPVAYSNAVPSFGVIPSFCIIGAAMMVAETVTGVQRLRRGASGGVAL